MKNKLLYLAALPLFISLCSFKNTTFSETNKVEASGIYKDRTVDEVNSYYSSLKDGLKGEELLSALQPVLKNGHKALTSSKAKSADWKYFLLLDRDWEKQPLTQEENAKQSWSLDNVVCKPLYDESFTYIKDNNPGDYINREHIFPKSYGFQSSSGYDPIAASDMLNLHMGEAKNNKNGHNNYPYGNVDKTKTYTKIISTISNTVTGYLGISSFDGKTQVYEPLDKDKGNIARAIFYMGARYHEFDAFADNSPALRVTNNPNDFNASYFCTDTKTKPCEYGLLNDLLDWNELDPVDAHEVHRNNLCYNAVQFNRNPFIDHPSWVKIAYGTTDYGIKKEATPKTIDGDEDISYQSKEVPVDPTPVDPTPIDPTPDQPQEHFEYYIYIFVFSLVVAILIVFVQVKRKLKKEKKNNKKAR